MKKTQIRKGKNNKKTKERIVNVNKKRNAKEAKEQRYMPTAFGIGVG